MVIMLKYLSKFKTFWLLMTFFIKHLCAHDPQENGVAEPNNRYLIKTTQNNFFIELFLTISPTLPFPLPYVPVEFHPPELSHVPKKLPLTRPFQMC